MKTLSFKLIAVIIIALTLPVALKSQSLYKNLDKLYFPNINGYITLKADFHTHTIFSDGLVYPEYRVLEAVKDGLDIIAITDHLEYKPFRADIMLNNYNRAFEIAKKKGDELGIIVIHGAEITRPMPPGHLNALFIKDANRLKHANINTLIDEAIRQGAFIIWNHPCWEEQQPDSVVWWDMHTKLHENFKLHGIEVYSYNRFCNEAWNWAIEKNLTVFANSDVHSSTYLTNFIHHRPATLVFSKSRCQNDIKNALFEGKTLSFSENILRGDKFLLETLLHNSLIVNQTNHKSRKNRRNTYMAFSITNTSPAPIELKKAYLAHDCLLPNELIIMPGATIDFSLMSKTKEVLSPVNYYANNFMYSPNGNAIFTLEINKDEKLRRREERNIQRIYADNSNNKTNTRSRIVRRRINTV